MKRRMMPIICCMVCLACLLCASCRSHGLLSDDFQAGDTVTPEELLEISRALFTEAESPFGVETEKEQQTLPPHAIVYWLTTGSVYHADRMCHHISASSPEKIREGDVSKAMAEGKERLCSSCAP